MAMKTIWNTLMLVRKSHPRAFLTHVSCVLIQSLLPLANLYFLQHLVDSLSDYQAARYYMLGFVAVFLLQRVVTVVATVNTDMLSQRLVDYISDLIQSQSQRLDMGYYDASWFHDTLHRAQQEASFRPLEMFNYFMSMLGSAVTLLGLMYILAQQSWPIVVIMVVAVLPSFFLRLHKAHVVYSFRRENTQSFRRTSYLSALLTQRDFAKEVRVFGLGSYFRQLFVSMRRRIVSRLLSISRRLAAFDLLCALFETAALMLVLVLFLRQTFSGTISIGSFVMLFEAFRRGQNAIRNVVQSLGGLYDSRLFAKNLFEFLNLKPRIVSPTHPQPFPEQVDRVDFCNITFRYPDMDHDVLSHFSLSATSGAICHIKGENGFGKSTLIKLLLRLYDPDEGSICINGIDIRQFDLVQLRSHMAVLFQDFVRYYFTAAENIAFGHLNINIANGEMVHDPLSETVEQQKVGDAAKKSGADDFLVRLPEGYATPLGRSFDNGAELSMGQWQRVALARMFYSDAPIVILDEPTAWMDFDSRTHFNRELETLKSNRIVFLIQHV